MQKLSSWTALVIIAVCLVISKHLAVGQILQTDQSSMPTSENSRGFLTAHMPAHIENLSQKAEILNRPSVYLDNQTEPSSTSRASPPMSTTALEQEVYEQINEYRLSRHLPSLVLDSRISEQARIHSQAMANSQVPFSQLLIEQRSEAISRMMPYQGMCEIVAYNFGYPDPGRAAVGSWIRNPKRVVSIEGEYDLTGIGVATNLRGEYYFTQIFIHRQ
jgi:uncharacterized protein YkwD